MAGVPLRVQWEPTLLAPSTPPEGWDLRYYMESFYGKEISDKFLSPNSQLKVAGRKVGIEFNDNRRLLQTLDSHRLIEFCREVKPERENDLMELMLWRYNNDAADMSKPVTLLECAVACGLPRNKVAIMLASDAYNDVVKSKIAENTAMLRDKKRGIPFATIGVASGEQTFSGMLPLGAKPEDLSDFLLEQLEAGSAGAA